MKMNKTVAVWLKEHIMEKDKELALYCQQTA